MTNDRKQAPHTEAGYTLVELLISLTILALLLAMVPGTLRLGKRAWETPGGLEEIPAASALAFAQQNIKSALPIYQTGSSGLPEIVFEGAESSLSFVAELAAGPAGGGLYRIDIGQKHSLAGSSGGPALRLTLFRPDATTITSGSEDRDLGVNYSGLHFKYFGSPAPGELARWQLNWNRSDRLPDLVDITATPRASAAAANSQYLAELKLRPIL